MQITKKHGQNNKSDQHFLKLFSLMSDETIDESTSLMAEDTMV